MVKINPTWQQRLERLSWSDEPIDETVAYHPAAQWLVMQLSKANRPFKVVNLGAGVRRITTNADTCPCCKRELEPRLTPAQKKANAMSAAEHCERVPDDEA